MVEAVVKSVQVKLANINEKKLGHLGGVGQKVKRVQCELTRMHSYLQDADKRCKGDVWVQIWLNELRDVAYRIEDATDTFFLEVDDHLKEDPSFLQNNLRLFRKISKLCCLCENPQKVCILQKLGTELIDIRNLLVQISKMWEDYGAQNLQEIVEEAVEMPIRRGTSQHVEETKFESLVADKNKILELLCANETPRLAVITILGTGGLGKTTLARMIYRSAIAEFGYHIMLSIPQNINLIDLLIKMLCQLKDSKPENTDMGDLIRELRSTLKEKRYLIILDGLWDVKWWNQLKFAFPDGKNSSRVLVTSRTFNVPDSKTYKLGFLDDKESQKLLLKKAFPYQQPGEEYPNDLIELAKKLSKKCNNLPLSLIVLGGILATKEPSYSVWKSVLQTMNRHSEGINYMNVMAMSYEDMAYYLKPCFLYLSSFPKDYEISAKCLIRMWIEEGFIQHEGQQHEGQQHEGQQHEGQQHEEQTTKKKIAEIYLEELFQRSIVQVSSRSIDGLIKCFKVRDQLHDLAMRQAEKENFVTIFSKATNVNQPNRAIRCASFQFYNTQLMEYVGTNTRTVLMFNHIPEWSKFRLLKVLYIVGVKNCTADHFRGLEKLIHLKFLVIRNCKINNPMGLGKLISFDHMKTLEILDLRGTELELSDALWTIRTLRYVNYDGNSANLPISTANLTILYEPISTAIETLRWVLPPRKWDSNLTLNNLHKLGLCMFSADHDTWVTAATNLLKTLPSLVYLQLRWNILPEDIPKNTFYPEQFPNYQNLKSLYLQGEWPKGTPLKASLFPRCLIKLKLSDSRLEKDPMPELGKLESLIKLYFEPDVVIYCGPLVCPPGFPVLRCLKLNDSNIQSLKVEQGAMPMLTYLEVDDNIELHLPQLQYLDRGNVQ